MILFLYIMFAHWVADFVCQTHWQATNKSKNWYALSAHVFNYSVCMWSALVAYLAYTTGLKSFQNVLELGGWFFVFTFATHFCTDAITSRISSKLYAKGDYHNFFVVIGFDQFIHYLTLAVTLWMLGLLQWQ